MIRISVIIPTYNRPDTLAACLDSLTEQQYPREKFEVIVVDDGGEVALEPIVQRLQKDINVKMVRQENTGPAGARNAGSLHATGAFIAFTDDDCKPATGWLETFMCHLQQDSKKMYGGHTVNALESNIYSSASQSLIDFLYGYYNAEPEQASFFTSNNIAMSQSMFELVGGFDAEFPGACGEDREFCDRWLHHGHGMSYISEASVYHRHELTFGQFWKQHFNYGTGAWRFRECKSRRDQQAPKVEPMFFYLGLLTHGWKQKLHRPFSLLILMVFSQFANAAGFVWEKFRSK